MKRLIYLIMLVILLAGILPAQTDVVYASCSMSVVVANTNDKDPGSLRQALLDVCAGGTITFDAGLSGQIITLTTAPLEVAKSMTIDGSALAVRVTIKAGQTSANERFAVFLINPGQTVTMDSLIITEGYTPHTGAGINNGGNLTIKNSQISNNVADVENGDCYGSDCSGGGIFNDGVLTIEESVIKLNHARVGGGIYNSEDGFLAIENSVIEENSALYGAGIYSGGDLTIKDSEVSDNDADYSGGGINSYGNLTINNSVIANNEAGDDGGGIYHYGDQYYDVTLTVVDSTIQGNSAKSGGGIYNWWKMALSGSTLVGNKLTVGDAGRGAGLVNLETGTATVANSTITGNIGSGMQGSGSGIHNNGSMSIYNSTFSGNHDAHTIFNIGSKAHLRIINTIIVDPGQRGGTEYWWGCANESGVQIVEYKNNLIVTHINDPNNHALCGETIPIDANLKLGILKDNGGPTWTMALLEGSPAINEGHAATCAGELVGGVDQRGVPRPQGAACDIGAYEREVYGELKITKAFNPLTSGFTGKFTIAYDCGTAHKGTVELGAGTSKTISAIPTGTACTVTEPTLPTAPAGWTFGTPTFNPATGKVTISGTPAEVTVTNTISMSKYQFFLPLIMFRGSP